MLKLIGILLLSINSISCTHMVMDNYPQYLENNAGDLDLPKVKEKVSYSLSESTERHKKEIWSFQAGWANYWAVEFAQVLDSTMESEDLENTFKEIQKSNSKKNLHINYLLEEYDFKHHRAYVTLRITASKNGKKLINKTYRAKGGSQGGKMFWGGAFGMRNAIHQSTKSAMDDILRKFISDLKRKVRKNNA